MKEKKAKKEEKKEPPYSLNEKLRIAFGVVRVGYVGRKFKLIGLSPGDSTTDMRVKFKVKFGGSSWSTREETFRFDAPVWTEEEIAVQSANKKK